MKLYLSSYRLGNDKSMLEDWVKESKNILVIPNAVNVFPDGERTENGIIDKCEDLKKLGFNIEILDLRKYFNKEDELREYLKNYKAFYVIGGNVQVLRQAMKLSGFDNYLKEIANQPDYLYSGFSAGICVLANNLHGIDLADDFSVDPYNYGDKIWDGIGLIDYMPVPHFDTPDHPESPLMYNVVKYLQENNLPYRTLKDGDVIVDELTNRNVKTL